MTKIARHIFSKSLQRQNLLSRQVVSSTTKRFKKMRSSSAIRVDGRALTNAGDGNEGGEVVSSKLVGHRARVHALILLLHTCSNAHLTPSTFNSDGIPAEVR